MAQTETIGEWLVRDNKLRQADLEQALLVNADNGNGIGPLLVRLGLVSDKDLAAAYAGVIPCRSCRMTSCPLRPWIMMHCQSSS